MRCCGGGPEGVVQLCAAIHLTISSSIIIFGIGVPPIWQGLLGVVMALEGHFGIVQAQPMRVLFFIVALLLNVAMGFLLGMLALKKQTYSECTIEGQAVRKEQNFTFVFEGNVQNCAFSYQMYAYVQFGTGIISFVCLLLTSLAYLSIRKRISRSRSAEAFLFSPDVVQSVSGPAFCQQMHLFGQHIEREVACHYMRGDLKNGVIAWALRAAREKVMHGFRREAEVDAHESAAPRAAANVICEGEMTSEALEAARSLQRSISGTCAATRLAATAAEKLHVTLAVVRPNDEEQTRRVARILQDLDAAWRPEVSRTLWVRDLGFFPGGRVCFLRPDDEGQWLHALAADVRAALLHEGIAFDPRPFAPHATIFKMSKVPRRRRGYKEAARFFRIMAGQDPDEASKSGSAEDDSGAELDSAAVSLRERLLHPEASWRPKQKTTATSLELCSMLDRPAPDGFYVVCVPGDGNAATPSWFEEVDWAELERKALQDRGARPNREDRDEEQQRAAITGRENDADEEEAGEARTALDSPKTSIESPLIKEDSSQTPEKKPVWWAEGPPASKHGPDFFKASSIRSVVSAVQNSQEKRALQARVSDRVHSARKKMNAPKSEKIRKTYPQPRAIHSEIRPQKRVLNVRDQRSHDGLRYSDAAKEKVFPGSDAEVEGDEFERFCQDGLRITAAEGPEDNHRCLKRLVSTGTRFLKTYQRAGVLRMLSGPSRCLLYDEMGLGKTLQSLFCMAFSCLRDRRWPALIVCPASLRSSWTEEIERWMPFLSIDDVSVVTNCRSAISENAKVIIISYRMLEDLSKEVLERGVHFLIADEVHKTRSYDSLQTRSLARVAQNVSRAILATGTPMLIRPFELYTQLSIVLSEEDKNRVMARWGWRAQTRSSEQAFLHESHLAQIFAHPMRHLRDMSFFVQFAEAAWMQPCSVAFMHSPSASGARSFWANMESTGRSDLLRLMQTFLADLVAMVRATFLGSSTASKTTFGPIVRKLENIASDRRANASLESIQHQDTRDPQNPPSAVIAQLNLMTSFWRVLRSAFPTSTDFLVALVHMWDAHCFGIMYCSGHLLQTLDKEERILIFARHLKVIDCIQSRLVAARGNDPGHPRFQRFHSETLSGIIPVPDRDRIIRSFQTDEQHGPRALVLSIEAMGVGVTLTRASVVVIAELHWSPQVLLQAEDRAHRIGLKDSVSIQYVLAEGTLDAKLWAMLSTRLNIMEHTLRDKAGKKSSSVKRRRPAKDKSKRGQQAFEAQSGSPLCLYCGCTYPQARHRFDPIELDACALREKVARMEEDGVANHSTSDSSDDEDNANDDEEGVSDCEDNSQKAPRSVKRPRSPPSRPHAREQQHLTVEGNMRSLFCGAGAPCQRSWQMKCFRAEARVRLSESEAGICRRCKVDTRAMFYRARVHPPGSEERCDAMFCDTGDLLCKHVFAQHQNANTRSRMHWTDLQRKVLGPTLENKLLNSASLQEGFFWDADHILAVRLGGGSTSISNFQTLCKPCHLAKTQMDRAAISRLKRDQAKHMQRATVAMKERFSRPGVINVGIKLICEWCGFECACTEDRVMHDIICPLKPD
ncbi:DNA annealing helicase and endonuclease ZRANB3 [Hondaea fermentalgiana]|uniref:DNA annealing helicase and endonuclease ZRANB3 n=1 Tax=Hondaea fermentalgiana TaxID=2315210 RepID=A0A2R5G7C2_9STRA|nr:DNA annealing helicase and endonuclease ZRANB3 [Hondaea fermentalgiana]|eukprot:GBG26952.1 DNA annealing helicase and endonuclease ZRANB3 [Hondaea fermentalgiana]